MRMIDDLKESTGVAVRMTSLAAAVALAFFITLSFLCAAAFVYVLQTYGLIEACLTGAGIFLLVALIATAVYFIRKRQERQHAEEATKSVLHTVLADPVMMATAVQVVRAIGLKKLVPLLAVGGLALGLFANRPSPDQTPAE